MRVSTKDLVRVNPTGMVKIMIKDTNDMFTLEYVNKRGFQPKHMAEAIDGTYVRQSFFFDTTIEQRNELHGLLHLIKIGNGHNVSHYEEFNKQSNSPADFTLVEITV